MNKLLTKRQKEFLDCLPNEFTWTEAIKINFRNRGTKIKSFASADTVLKALKSKGYITQQYRGCYTKT